MASFGTWIISVAEETDEPGAFWGDFLIHSQSLGLAEGSARLRAAREWKVDIETVSVFRAVQISREHLERNASNSL